MSKSPSNVVMHAPVVLFLLLLVVVFDCSSSLFFSTVQFVQAARAPVWNHQVCLNVLASIHLDPSASGKANINNSRHLGAVGDDSASPELLREVLRYTLLNSSTASDDKNNINNAPPCDALALIGGLTRTDFFDAAVEKAAQQTGSSPSPPTLEQQIAQNRRELRSLREVVGTELLHEQRMKKLDKPTTPVVVLGKMDWAGLLNVSRFANHTDQLRVIYDSLTEAPNKNSSSDHLLPLLPPLIPESARRDFLRIGSYAVTSPSQLQVTYISLFTMPFLTCEFHIGDDANCPNDCCTSSSHSSPKNGVLAINPFALETLRWLDATLAKITRAKHYAVLIGELPFGVHPFDKKENYAPRQYWDPAVTAAFLKIMHRYCNTLLGITFATTYSSHVRFVARRQQTDSASQVDLFKGKFRDENNNGIDDALEEEQEVIGADQNTSSSSSTSNWNESAESWLQDSASCEVPPAISVGGVAPQNNNPMSHRITIDLCLDGIVKRRQSALDIDRIASSRSSSEVDGSTSDHDDSDLRRYWKSSNFLKWFIPQNKAGGNLTVSSVRDQVNELLFRSRHDSFMKFQQEARGKYVVVALDGNDNDDSAQQDPDAVAISKQHHHTSSSTTAASAGGAAITTTDELATYIWQRRTLCSFVHSTLIGFFSCADLCVSRLTWSMFFRKRANDEVQDQLAQHQTRKVPVVTWSQSSSSSAVSSSSNHEEDDDTTSGASQNKFLGISTTNSAGDNNNGDDTSIEDHFLDHIWPPFWIVQNDMLWAVIRLVVSLAFLSYCIFYFVLHYRYIRPALLKRALDICERVRRSGGGHQSQQQDAEQAREEKKASDKEESAVEVRMSKESLGGPSDKEELSRFHRDYGNFRRGMWYRAIEMFHGTSALTSAREGHADLFKQCGGGAESTAAGADAASKSKFDAAAATTVMDRCLCRYFRWAAHIAAASELTESVRSIYQLECREAELLHHAPFSVRLRNCAQAALLVCEAIEHCIRFTKGEEVLFLHEELGLLQDDDRQASSQAKSAKSGGGGEPDRIIKKKVQYWQLRPPPIEVFPVQAEVFYQLRELSKRTVQSRVAHNQRAAIQSWVTQLEELAAMCRVHRKVEEAEAGEEPEPQMAAAATTTSAEGETSNEETAKEQAHPGQQQRTPCNATTTTTTSAPAARFSMTTEDKQVFWQKLMRFVHVHYAMYLHPDVGSRVARIVDTSHLRVTDFENPQRRVKYFLHIPVRWFTVWLSVHIILTIYILVYTRTVLFRYFEFWSCINRVVPFFSVLANLVVDMIVLLSGQKASFLAAPIFANAWAEVTTLHANPLADTRLIVLGYISASVNLILFFSVYSYSRHRPRREPAPPAPAAKTQAKTNETNDDQEHKDGKTKKLHEQQPAARPYSLVAKISSFAFTLDTIGTIFLAVFSASVSVSLADMFGEIFHAVVAALLQVLEPAEMLALPTKIFFVAFLAVTNNALLYAVELDSAHRPYISHLYPCAGAVITFIVAGFTCAQLLLLMLAWSLSVMLLTSFFQSQQQRRRAAVAQEHESTFFSSLLGESSAHLLSVEQYLGSLKMDWSNVFCPKFVFPSVQVLFHALYLWMVMSPYTPNVQVNLFTLILLSNFTSWVREGISPIARQVKRAARARFWNDGGGRKDDSFDVVDEADGQKDDFDDDFDDCDEPCDDHQDEKEMREKPSAEANHQ